MANTNPGAPKIPDQLPKSYGALQGFLQEAGIGNPFTLRLETFRRIEKRMGRPLLCYACRTWNVAQGTPAFIDDGDLVGFGDLVDSVDGDKVDILIISNGGSAEATERIVRRLRDRFSDIRFIVPSNAYSAATLMCFSGNKVLMLPEGTLGPIDPQLNGIPARAILRSFETLEERLANEGAKALTAYVPLLQKYDLHLLEQCRSAQQLSEELARAWLSMYSMRGRNETDIESVVDYFGNWDLHKSHGRSIDAGACQKIGVPTVILKGDAASLVRSLFHQYALFFDKTTFYKVFENAAGIAWGRQQIQQVVPIPFQGPGGLPTAPESGEPGESST